MKDSKIENDEAQDARNSDAGPSWFKRSVRARARETRLAHGEQRDMYVGATRLGFEGNPDPLSRF